MAHRKVGVKVAARSEIAPARRPVVDEVDPSFHRAILKIALELKKPSLRTYGEIVDATISAMRLGENGARNMSLLLATARSGGT